MNKYKLLKRLMELLPHITKLEAMARIGKVR